MKASKRQVGPARFGVLLCAVFATTHQAPAAVIGQVDTFEDGTTQNSIVNLLGMELIRTPQLINPPAALPARVTAILNLSPLGAAARAAVWRQ